VPLNDRELLRRAVELSRERMLAGDGGPFGAVIACEGEIVAEGFNRVTSTNDPTGHAEIVAIREACAALGRFDLRGCVLYSSCEPCPMCLGAVYWARLDRLVYANTREQAARIGFDDAAIYAELALPLEQQSLPSERVDLPEAREVFALWEGKGDRIPY
jgi:guanine deaminase